MITLPLLLLALGLAADCFAVALAQGATMRTATGRDLIGPTLILALAFGAAQGLMPLIGWGLGVAFHDLIESFDHWVAFALLAFIGGKMIVEGVRGDPPGEEQKPPASLLAILGLAIAVSIDAAAAGFTLTTMGASIAISVLTIGGVSFLATLCGVHIGRAGAAALGGKAEIAGGLILIAIGAKVLIDHQAFG
jgi:putative Mn2+ efflux pump MntP